MKNKSTRLNILNIFIILISLVSFSFAKGGKERVNFGSMQIKGQTKNSDAVYMSDRGQFQQKSQIKPRKRYTKKLKYSSQY